MTITSGLNSGLPAAPLADDPVLNGELQIIYNTLRNIIQALNDAGIPSGGITPSATILPVVNGGTGINTATGLLKGNGTAAMSAVATSSTVGQVLRVTGANTYVWGAVNLADTDAITGNLPVTNLNAGTGAAAGTYWQGNGTWGTPAGTATGDVVGPASATIGGIALYDGITGKLIKDLGTGLTTQILVGGGAATNPVWTVATGTGAPVRTTNPTIVTPTIASFINANHDHSNAAGGGAIPAASITGTALVAAAIGTTVQAYDADLTTWAGITPGTGVGTALAVNVGSAGAFVTFNGALGTPSSGTLTNATGLPAAGVVGTALVSAAIGTTVQAYDADLTTWAGVTPGTGVATALAVNVGSAGAVVLFNGAGGTPSSMTGTNITGIPAAGVTGTALVAAAIGTTVQAYDSDLTTWAGITPAAGIATFLATPSGTNLGSALTSALTVAKGGTALTGGTSGGVLYFSGTGTLASSAALAANSLVQGGGAGVAPSTITTGTGVITALGVNTGSAGAVVLFNGALGTPASGIVTNLTGTASININGTVGAATPAAGTFSSLISQGTFIFGGSGAAPSPATYPGYSYTYSSNGLAAIGGFEWQYAYVGSGYGFKWACNSATDSLDLGFRANSAAWTKAFGITNTGLIELPIGQVKFPATANPSSDVNTLDDYEEGTFTATLTGCTTSPTGTIAYVKIGKSVTLSLLGGITGTSNTTAKTLTGIPASLYPGTAVEWMAPIQNNSGLFYPGLVVLDIAGVITLSADLQGTAFTAAGACFIRRFTVAYCL